MSLDRHQIVRLHPSAWPALLDTCSDPKTNLAIIDWALEGRPMIARRRLCSDAAGDVPLGLPLPPVMGKQRLAFAVAADAVLSTERPPLLADAITAAPIEWRPTLAALIEIDRRVRCFGGLAWQYLTGMAYLSATSDIDLLWHVATAEGADRLVEAIASIDAAAPMRLDGEIVTLGGLAIQWREWASGAPELLVKTAVGSQMRPRGAVFS